MLVSAGVTFFLLLALFPALAAFVSLYGLVADPRTISGHIAFLGTLLPADGLDFIRAQIGALISKNEATLGFGFLFGLAVALWSANSGMKALFDVMNVAYEETERRGFVMLNLLSMAFTMGAVLIWISFLLLIGLVPALLALLWLDRWAEQLVSIGRWPVLVLLVMTGIAILYRYGPSREHARWRWLTWGAALATTVWIIASAAFSFYLQNFANYNATYGSLGAVMGLMVWTWLSVMIVAIGAEINAEIEHQTARDTTTGPALPMGERGATMADTLGRTFEDEPAAQVGERAGRTIPAFANTDHGTAAHAGGSPENQLSGNHHMANAPKEAETTARLAREQGVSEDAVKTVLDALRRSGGTMAQFSHADFGGMSQWSSGMTMVGDMFNDGLKAKLNAIAGELSSYLRDHPTEQRRDETLVSYRSSGTAQARSWWPEALGNPSSVGSQNDMRYAVFPEKRRLVIDDHGRTKIYDTGDHHISGVSQGQSADSTLTFVSQHGVVRVSDLAGAETA